MITELSRENCWSLRQNESSPVLVACLNQTTYRRQLKALIELSEAFNEGLKIYITRDATLNVFINVADITGTPTYILLWNGVEQGRLLGEADAERLKNFVGLHLEASARKELTHVYGISDGFERGCGRSSETGGMDKQ